MRIYSDKYSNYYDVTTKAQFTAILDRRTGCYVGLAIVHDVDAMVSLLDRGFVEVDDEMFLAMTTTPAPPLVETLAPVTGDPLVDGAAVPPSPAKPAPSRLPDTAPTSATPKGRAAKATPPSDPASLPAPPAPPASAE